MATENLTIWQTKKAITKEYEIRRSSPFVADDKIIFLTEYQKKYDDFSGICIYDEKEDQIKIIQKYTNDYKLKNGDSYCYDEEQQEIFIVTRYDGIISYNMTSQSWRKESKSKYIGTNASSIYMNHQVHIFCGSMNKYHLIYETVLLLLVHFNERLLLALNE